MRALGRRGPGIVPRKFRPLLDGEGTRLWPSFVAWIERASAGDVVAAFGACRDPDLRGFMCYRVGKRGLHAARPMLVHALNDPDPAVRGEAAYALENLEDPSTGYDLLRRYAVEDDPDVRAKLLLALGWTRYAPALPALIEALADADLGFRYALTLAVAAMGDKSALPALWQTYAQFPEGRDKEFMRRAIDELERD